MDLELINIALNGVSFIMNTYFQFKGQRTEEVKASVTINKVFINHNSCAMNISITNNTAKPFSIIKLFMQHGELVYDVCRIINVVPINTNSGNRNFTLGTDLEKYQYENVHSEGFSIESFNIHAYLLENQAETGWVVFKIPKEHMVINKIGIKISSTDEVLYAD